MNISFLIIRRYTSGTVRNMKAWYMFNAWRWWTLLQRYLHCFIKVMDGALTPRQKLRRVAYEDEVRHKRHIRAHFSLTLLSPFYSMAKTSNIPSATLLLVRKWLGLHLAVGCADTVWATSMSRGHQWILNTLSNVLCSRRLIHLETVFRVFPTFFCSYHWCD